MSASPSDTEARGGGGPAWGPATLLSALVHVLALVAALAVAGMPEPRTQVPPPVIVELVKVPAESTAAPSAALAEPASPAAAAVKPPPQPAATPVRTVAPRRKAVTAPAPGSSAIATAPAPSSPAAGSVPASNGYAGMGSEETSVSAVNADAVAAYLAEVRARLQRAIIYPGKARRVGLQGVVMVRFHIAADGGVPSGSVRVRNDDAHPLLVAGAEDTVMAVSLPPPPLPGMDIEVPLAFRLDRGGEIGVAHSGG